MVWSYSSSLLYASVRDGRSIYCANVLGRLVNERNESALRTYKFWQDMFMTLRQMYRILKPGAKAAIIIGNNNYSINGKAFEVRNDDAIQELAENTGFNVQNKIHRTLEKIVSGNIRYENILVLQK